MFRLLKPLFWLLIIIAAVFLWWFLPKYNFIHKNPQYCVNITKNIFYCGDQSDLKSFFNIKK